MALIRCPECQREISNYCISCPHCGYPMNTDPLRNGGAAPNPPPATDRPQIPVTPQYSPAHTKNTDREEEKERENGSGCLKTIAAAVIIAIIVFIIVLCINSDPGNSIRLTAKW